jgi:hypothetical protein
MIDDSSSVTQVEIDNNVNVAYQEIASESPWNLLTVLKQGEFTVLPSDLTRILYVEDDTDYLYFKRGIPQRYNSRTLYNYFMNLHQTTPLLTVEDAVTTANSTTVTSATGGFVEATHVGEYVRVGSNLGRYKIASVTDTNTLELDDGFRGDAETAAHLEIRPRGTQKIMFTNDEGGARTSSTLKMWYLQKPLPLYNDYDEVMLPGTAEALFIRTLQLMNIGEKYENDALKLEGMYQIAFDKMTSLPQAMSQYVVPRGADDRRWSYGRVRRSRVIGIHEAYPLR